MEVLFTGNLPVVSDDFFKKIEADYRCVTFFEKEKLEYHGKNVTSYYRNENETELSDVFTAFSFDAVVYFSYTLDGSKQPFGELEYLENVLYQCRKKKIERLIYVTCNNLPEKEREMIEETGYLILKDACESLCLNASEHNDLKVEILKVPYLFRKCADEKSLPFLKDVIRNRQAVFPGNSDFETDFLCDEDLGELLVRVLDDTSPAAFETLHLEGGNAHTFYELGELMKSYFPNTQITYGADRDCIPRHRGGSKARTEYGWYPQNRIEDTLSAVEQEYALRKKMRKSYDRRKNRHQWKERIRVILEVIISFGIAELLNWWTSGNVMLNFIDFRLVYVAMMGTMNGLTAGTVAAILSSLGYITLTVSETPWQILFYNVQNWLPFACYFLLGAISGYTRDRHDDEVLYQKEEYDIMEEKYIFLNSLYTEVLAGKEEFNNQIIGYRDSYGKMYSIVKKLDSTLPEQVFYEAVSVLEEMLNNRYVAIFSIDKNSIFARLKICSKNCTHELAKSLKITDYPAILDEFESNKIFRNTQAREGYPAYATPIFRNEELVGMIMLTRVEANQMNMEFSNKFHIVTNLIRDSLIRAMDYYEQSGVNLEGTRVLNSKNFKEVLTVKEQMRQKQYLEFMLLKIKDKGEDIRELSDKVSKMIRNNDVLGMGEDGGLYLLLSQTRQEDMGVVEERFLKKGIEYDVVNGL